MSLTTLSIALLIAGTGNSPVSAQDAENNTLKNSSTVTYAKEYFDKYSPVTLTDMLERIPGVPSILDQSENRQGQNRGFGSGGDQILIDGKRLSAKSNSIRDVLSRTSANMVKRIELIRGATGGLDVQSEGMVVNIVMDTGVSKASTFWKIKGLYMVGKDVSPEFEVSHKNSTGKLDYSLAIEGERKHGYFFRDDIYYNAQSVRTGEKDLDGDYRFSGIKIIPGLSYNFKNKAVLNLNGSVEPGKFENFQTHNETGDDAEHLQWDFEENFTNWEAGGDYSQDLGKLGKLKTLFLINKKIFDNHTTRLDGLGAAQFEYNFEQAEYIIKEDIYRASLTKNINAKQSIEFGGEGAFNNLYQKFDNYERDAINDPLELTTTNNIKIKENRYEVFAHHNYNIAPNLVLQSSLTTEFSTITADTVLADGSIDRKINSFTYLKPRFNFRYDLDKNNQFRLVAEKKVSQLDFFHYVTFFDQQTKELKFGNRDIRPEKTWEFSATYEHRLSNDGGTLEAEIFYKKYKDYITRVDFSEYENFSGGAISSDQFFALPPTVDLRDMIDFTSKSGNVDHASSYGVNLKSNTRLGIIGLKDAQLGIDYKFEKRRFVDPFTQLTRGFSWVSDHVMKINFRHDLTKWKLSYGIEAEFKSNHKHADINYNWQWYPSNQYEIFVEYKLFKDIKLKLVAEQNGRTNENATFNRYTDHVRFAEFKSRDEQIHDRPHEVSVSIEGTF